MLWIAALAHAATLPECPAVTTPEEAWLARDDRGVGALYEALKDEAEARASGVCVTRTSETADDGTVTVTCVHADGVVVRRSTYEDDVPADEWTYPSAREVATLDVERPAGAEWTRLTIEETTASASYDYGGYGASSSSATWSGAPLGLPDEGAVTFGASTTTDWWTHHEQDAASVNGCAWRWGTYDGAQPYFVDASIHVRVMTEDECDVRRDVAYVDDVRYGRVDGQWRLVELDGDGFSEADGDCDDTDATVHPCSAEVELDGVDQDCDGEDAADADGDGHNDVAGGGDDCDDTDRTVYAGARDFGGDGIDQDCDGHDDIDADGDGRTVDGDSADPDCDDTDASVNPGASEIPYDGVDQDCDGEDATDLDADGYVAAEAGGDDCDDAHPRRHPGAYEPPCDGVDDDCDGADACDDEAPTPARGCAPSAPLTWLGATLALVAARRRRA